MVESIHKINRLLTVGLMMISLNLVLIIALFLSLIQRIQGLAEFNQSLICQIDLLAGRDTSPADCLDMLEEISPLLELVKTQNRTILREISEGLLENEQIDQKETSLNDRESLQVFESSDSQFLNQSKARVHALETLARSPFNREALTFLGRISFEESDLNLSLNYFSRLIDIEPENREAYLCAARSSYGLEDYSRAQLFGKELLNLGERSEYWVFLARCYYQLQDYDQSVDAVNNALFLDKSNLDALELGGQVSWKGEDYEAAMDYYSRALEIEPEKSFLVALGDLHYQLCSKEMAYQFWSRAVAGIPAQTRQDQEEQLELYEKMSLCAYEMGNFTGLDDCFYRAGLLGGRESIHILLVRREKDLDHPGEALKRAREFRKKYPRSSFDGELDRILLWAKGE